MSGVRVRLNQPRLRKIAGVQLRPGIQRLTGEEWSAVRKHPIGAANIERGVLQEVESRGRGRPSADDLIAEIAETYDVERLHQLQQDSRKTVADAATKQLEAIESAGG